MRKKHRTLKHRSLSIKTEWITWIVYYDASFYTTCDQGRQCDSSELREWFKIIQFALVGATT
jgi:hypothetical protein